MTSVDSVKLCCRFQERVFHFVNLTTQYSYLMVALSGNMRRCYKWLINDGQTYSLIFFPTEFSQFMSDWIEQPSVGSTERKIF